MIIPENPNMPSSPRRNALSGNRGCKRDTQRTGRKEQVTKAG